MRPLVTVAVPIYKRLQYVPRILGVVAAQTYPQIELLVSDNGRNGTAVRDQVQSLYSRPYKFRQNEATVNIAQHFNQILEAASGEYLIILPDDDEISSDFVAELVAQLEQHPGAVMGFARQEIVDEAGALLGKSVELFPDVLSGCDFILDTWERNTFQFQSVTVFLGKTREMRRCGGFADFTRGNHIDDAMVVKMCLRGDVVFSSKGVYRNLVEASSAGWSVTAQQLAAAVREFMRFLDDDPVIREFALSHPSEWRNIKRCLVQMSWGTYLWRWRDVYRKRLSFFPWARAAFAMPFIPDYYRKAFRTLLESVLENRPHRTQTTQA